jgi:hypothetical protein
MVKNKFYKNTLGLFGEIIIASTLDVEETSATSAQPSVASITVGIAADPTPGDLINIVVDGVTYTHTVPVGDETTQQAHDAILALLQSNSQGFTVTAHSGTTTSVYQLAWGLGTAKNGKVVSSTETGTTFTSFADATFAGGVNADAAAADDWEAFVASSNAGTIWAFWEDLNSGGRHEALVVGDTANPANAGRKFFYGWKDSAGNAKCSIAIPVAGLKYDSIAYNAGTLQISKVKYGGTYAAGQIIHVRITETTPLQTPYPSWDYDTPYVDTIDNAVIALAALVNAELESPVATATVSTDTLILTGVDRTRTFKATAYIETIPTQPTDASAITYPTSGTAVAKAAIGDVAQITELQQYQIIHGGGINYATDMTNVSEWQTTNSNIGSTTEWGTLIVSAYKIEAGVVRDHTSRPYVIIAVPTGVEATLATL